MQPSSGAACRDRIPIRSSRACSPPRHALRTQRPSRSSCATCNGPPQCYERNTAIVVTELADRHGGRLRVTDFCPRFRQYGRMFHPVTIVRPARAARRPSAGARALPAACGIRRARAAGDPRQQSSALDGAGHGAAPDDGLPRSPALTDDREFVVSEPVALLFGVDEAPNESGSPDWRGGCATARATTGRNGCVRWRFPSNGRRK